MKKALRELRQKIRTIKSVKAQAKRLTSSLPCVNLFVKAGIRGNIKIYNNDDLIAQLSADEAGNMLSLGEYFFSLLLYSLCLKNSIEKYF